AGRPPLTGRPPSTCDCPSTRTRPRVSRPSPGDAPLNLVIHTVTWRPPTAPPRRNGPQWTYVGGWRACTRDRESVPSDRHGWPARPGGLHAEPRSSRVNEDGGQRYGPTARTAA